MWTEHSQLWRTVVWELPPHLLEAEACSPAGWRRKYYTNGIHFSSTQELLISAHCCCFTEGLYFRKVWNHERTSRNLKTGSTHFCTHSSSRSYKHPSASSCSSSCLVCSSATRGRDGRTLRQRYSTNGEAVGPRWCGYALWREQETDDDRWP